jgi:hypothetical protein
VFPGQFDPISGDRVPDNEIILHFVQGQRGDDGNARDPHVIVDAGGPADFVPAATVTGPADGLRGQSRTFTVSASSLSPDTSVAGFSYTIDWDDGSPVQTVARSPGNGAGVPLDHVFARSGLLTVKVTATDANGLASAPATATVTVTDPAVTAAGGFTLAATAGADSASQAVATFTDPGGAEPVSYYSATITWGDNTSSAGAITFDPVSQVFTVWGDHAYAAAGSYPVAVTIQDGSSPSVTAASMAAVVGNSTGPAALQPAVFVNAAWAGLAPGTHPDGSPTGAVIGVNAFASIQAAVNATLSGGTVTVAAGTYAESLTLARSVILVGSGSGGTVLAGPGGGLGLSVTAPGVEIRGLTVRGFHAGLVAGGGTVWLALTDVRLSGNAYGGAVTGVATVLITGGSGGETFFVRPGMLAHEGDNPLGFSGVRNVTVDGGGGSNRLVVYLNDSAAPDTVWLTVGAVARDGAPFLLWYRSAGGDFGGGVAVVLGEGPEIVVVQGQLAGAPLTIYGEGGDGTFYVSVTARSAYAGLTLDGGAGDDSLAVFDTSGGATVQNVVTVIGQGEVDVMYAGAVASRVLYQNLEQILGALPAASG